MKRLLFLLSIVLTLSLQAQRQITKYKDGEVQLVSDPAYAKNTNLNKLFPDAGQSEPAKSRGVVRSMVIAPDGSVFMSLRTKHLICKFDKQGNFIKSFGKKGGKKPCDFIYEPTVQGILDGKYVYTTAVDGRMHFFDLNGNWVKTISLKYMPLNTYPLKGGRIAIVGFSVGKQNRTSVRILNFSNGVEREVFSEIDTKRDEASIIITPNTRGEIDSDGKYHVAKTYKPPVIGCSLPFSDDMYYRVRVSAASDGTLIVANPSNGQITVYNQQGQKIKQFSADIKPEVISKEDREEYYQKAAKDLKKLEEDMQKSDKDKAFRDEYIYQCKAQLYKFRDPASYPEHLPYFSEMMVDEDNNILLFRFTRAEGSNKFDVYTYDHKGVRIASSSFVSDSYELKINPAVFRFHNRCIYSYVRKKDAGNSGYELVKFNLR
jgi:hypothetical protein